MDLHNIITTLTPINKKDKVDTLIQMISENGIRMDKNVDLSIRYAIQKLSIQNYYIETYGNLWKEQTNAQEHQVKETKQIPPSLNTKENILREAEIVRKRLIEKKQREKYSEYYDRRRWIEEEILRKAEIERRRLITEQQRKIEMEKERKRQIAEENMLREIEEKKYREAEAEVFLNSIGEKKREPRHSVDELITKELRRGGNESQMGSPIMSTFGAAYKEESKRKRDAFKRKQKPSGNNVAITTKSSVKPIYIPAGGMNKKY